MDVKLVLVKDNGKHKSFPLSEGATILGRRHDCDLRIPLLSVSRRHCQFNLQNGNIKLRDLQSSNGTLVNGKVVDETEVKAGDTIKIGPLTFLLQVDGAPRIAPGESNREDKKSEKPGSQKASSDIFDEVIKNGDLPELDEEESDDLDFLSNED